MKYAGVQHGSLCPRVFSKHECLMYFLNDTYIEKYGAQTCMHFEEMRMVPSITTGVFNPVDLNIIDEK